MIWMPLLYFYTIALYMMYMALSLTLSSGSMSDFFPPFSFSEENFLLHQSYDC